MQAGHEADAAGKGGQRAPAVEEALAAEALFEALHGREQGPQADLLHPLDDELHLAAAFVHAELAVQADGVAVVRAKADERGLAAKQDGGKLCAGILDGEITVATAGRTPV